MNSTRNLVSEDAFYEIFRNLFLGLICKMFIRPHLDYLKFIYAALSQWISPAHFCQPRSISSSYDRTWMGGGGGPKWSNNFYNHVACGH